MATEFTLRRGDGRPLGTFAEVQAVLGRLFPGVEFWWTTTGPEKIRQAAEHGGEMLPMIREAVENLPSMLDGICFGDGFIVESSLGPTEPVTELYVQPRGHAAELDHRPTALEAEYQGRLVVSG